MTHVPDTQTAKRLKSKPQDALEGVVLSVCGNKNLLFFLNTLINTHHFFYKKKMYIFKSLSPPSRSACVTLPSRQGTQGRTTACTGTSSCTARQEPARLSLRRCASRRGCGMSGAGAHGTSRLVLTVSCISFVCGAETGDAFCDGLRNHDWRRRGTHGT